MKRPPFSTRNEVKMLKCSLQEDVYLIAYHMIKNRRYFVLYKRAPGLAPDNEIGWGEGWPETLEEAIEMLIEVKSKFLLERLLKRIKK